MGVRTRAGEWEKLREGDYTLLVSCAPEFPEDNLDII